MAQGTLFSSLLPSTSGVSLWSLYVKATLTTASAQGVLTEAGNLRFAVQTGHAGDVPHR